MTHLSLGLIGVTLLFVVILLLRKLFSWRICALCAAVSITWITLLIMSYAGIEIDSQLITLLVGGSVVGILYLLEDRLEEKYHILRLPFFLTLIVSGYLLITLTINWESLLVLAVVWLLTFLVFSFRQQPWLRSAAKEIIKCCKDW